MKPTASKNQTGKRHFLLPQSWHNKNALLPIAVILLIILGWVIVLRQDQLILFVIVGLATIVTLLLLFFWGNSTVQREQTNIALRESEKRYRTLVEAAPVCIIVHCQGKFVFLNPEAVRTLGGTHESQFLGKPVMDFVHPDDHEIIHDRIENVLGGTGATNILQEKFVTLNGEVIFVETAGNRIDYAGQPAAQVVFRDVTDRVEAEKALQESEARFKMLFEYAPDAYYLIDMAANFIDGNRAAEEMIGYKREDLIGKNFLELNLLSPEETLNAAQLFAKNIEGLPTGPNEYILTRGNGEKITAEIITFPVEFKGERVVLGIARNVTGRKEAEIALKISETKYRRIFESIQDVYSEAGFDGTILEVSPSINNISKYTRQELIGQSLYDYYAHPEDRADLLEQLQQHGQVNDYEILLRDKDGQEIHCAINARLITNTETGLPKIISSMRNITDRKKTEATVHRRNKELTLLNRVGRELSATLDIGQVGERLLQAVVETIGAQSASVWLWHETRTGCLVCRAVYRPDHNRSLIDLYLKPQEGVAGWVAHNGESVILNNVKDSPHFNPEIDKKTGFQTRSLLSVPLRVRDETIGVLEVANKNEADFDTDDLVLAETLAASAAIAIQNARLIETLRERTLELQTQNEELDAFAHTVAHDLKHPLGHMIGYAEYLDKSFTGLSNDDIQHHLQTISNGGRKMVSIIDELLLLAGVRQKKTVKITALNMAAIVNEAQHRLSSIIAQQQAVISLPDQWPIALGYAPWIEEVWVNYISNAIKYGGIPRQIQLGADKQPDGQTQFWIQDNGPGLTPEEQHQLFTPFTRLNQVHLKGHGLGLSIVRRIVEKLGGQVGVESNGLPDQGCKFWFTLPSSQDNATPTTGE